MLKDSHMSEKSRKKVTASLIGNKRRLGKSASEETKIKLRIAFQGKNNPMFGKQRSEQTKQKISDTRKLRKIPSPWKGKHPNEETRRKISEAAKNRINSEESNLKRSFSLRGEKHYNWQGGISFEPYCLKFNRKLKEQIRERDNRTCQLCGEKENGRKLTCHHIHYDKPNCEPDLIALCRCCNSKANTNRDYYEELFMKKLRERELIR